MCLAVAVSILLDEDDELWSKHIGYASLVSFVKELIYMYGQIYVSYNVHSPIHLPDNCVTFNTSLNELSAFPFENFLGKMKRMLRNANNPIAQVVK